MSGHPNSRSISSQLRFGLLVAGWVLSLEVIAMPELSSHVKCPEGWVAKELEPKFCFKKFDKNNEKSTYSTASSTCSENGGVLISTDDVEVAAYSEKPAVWIRGKDANSVCQVYKWRKSEYRSIECTEKRAFICKRVAKEIIFYGRVISHWTGRSSYLQCDVHGSYIQVNKHPTRTETENKIVYWEASGIKSLLFLPKEMACSSSRIYEYRCMDPSTRQNVKVSGAYVLEPKTCEFLWLPTPDKTTLSATFGETAQTTLAAITDRNQDVHNVALTWYRNNQLISNGRKPKLSLLQKKNFEGIVYILIEIQFTPIREEDYGDWMVATGLYPSSIFKFTVEWKGLPALCPLESDNREFTQPLNEPFSFSVCYVAADFLPDPVSLVTKDPQDGRYGFSTKTKQFQTRFSKMANYKMRYKLTITNDAVRKEDLGTYKVYVGSPGRKISGSSLSFKLTAAGPPECPVDVNVTDQTSHSVTLTWVPGQDGGAPQSFIIFYNISTDGQTWDSRHVQLSDNATFISSVVDRLPADTSFQFRVEAVNKYSVNNESCYINTVEAKTDPAAPSEIAQSPPESFPESFSLMAIVVITIALVIGFLVVMVAVAVLGFLVCRKRNSLASKSNESDDLRKETALGDPEEGYMYANSYAIQPAGTSFACPQELQNPNSETMYINPVYSNTAAIMDNMGTEGSAVTM
ncbi:obscurin-like protein 1 isoform x11 [Plakobranchus ocellatus]|uniref:Obscurin-like protein 1 isoform x11 n=1 Tax=Plakobranchus ocellatus TaxID=259542 RepID=A0AAV4C0N4_9GAST|nr:obscurin-like protein 1 isoform x11 [Plakobranchus ocellatus]